MVNYIFATFLIIAITDDQLQGLEAPRVEEASLVYNNSQPHSQLWCIRNYVLYTSVVHNIIYCIVFLDCSMTSVNCGICIATQ